MASTTQHRRRVGSARPSHLMFTSGIGALVDLPNFAVLVRGTDDWRYDTLPDWNPLSEPRLLQAVSNRLSSEVTQLRPAPWLDGLDQDPRGPAARVGVPTIPFPQWLRCTACHQLAPLDFGIWGFENDLPRKPDKARFFHDTCRYKKSKKPLAVAARFVLACTNGHLDDFPYLPFVHKGGACPEVDHPLLQMADYGGNQGPAVTLRCLACKTERPISDAMGWRGKQNLPLCRGRHPHLETFDPNGCDAEPKVLILGASNQWFPEVLSALAVPPTGASALRAKVEQVWEDGLAEVKTFEVLQFAVTQPKFAPLKEWPLEEVWQAIEAHRASLAEAQPAATAPVDLRTPEWEIFSATPAPEPTEDFALRRDPDGVPPALSDMFADVVQAERLREVRALVGFTRLEAPDPDDPDTGKSAPLARDQPAWVPASEVRGEGIFLRVPEDLITEWEEKIATSAVVSEHREAFKRFRYNRYSGRIQNFDEFDPLRGWPGPRYIALHTLSHLLIRTVALECGYNSASLSEQIYSGEGRAGILIYTAVPDAEGTLGGLVSLAEPDSLERLVRRAMADARRCSSDPLCAERLPRSPSDLLHGAACHVCLFVSETTCERGNRFLDRRFVVPVDDTFPPLFTDRP
ncbi:DUF1998 domain-containing protein [Salinactinospora qingdaonensis]|uniref:DUF1998 domain-containing protein n=1 Tax=Salinactinospora qingdaonensis TaxID=702744 RepID=A0ABP7G7K5_9ACTN